MIINREKILVRAIEKARQAAQKKKIHVIVKNDDISHINSLVNGNIKGVNDIMDKVFIEKKIINEKKLRADRNAGKSIIASHMIDCFFRDKWVATIWSEEKKWSNAEARTIGGKLLSGWEIACNRKKDSA